MIGPPTLFERTFYGVEMLIIYYVVAINLLYLILTVIGFFSLQRFRGRMSRLNWIR